MKTAQQSAIEFVRDMAESIPGLKTHSRKHMGDIFVCRWCREVIPLAKSETDHNKLCPWIRARELRISLKTEGLLV